MIGLVDSGLGGLSIYLPLRSRLESADVLYLADAQFAPYGTKSATEIIERMERITRWFQAQGVCLIVIACNTATVNAIEALRAFFPTCEFIGIEPAVKPAAEVCNRIIVLATESTVHNERYHALVRRSIIDASDGNTSEVFEGLLRGERGAVYVTRSGTKVIWHVGANDLVRQVEAGKLQDTLSLERHLSLPSRQADGLVIGCTHFSFLRPTIEQRWPSLAIFDGADGVVRRTIERARALGLDRGDGRSLFLTTGPDRTVSFIHPPIHLHHVEL